ncbi:MAG: ABC transporter substrate-binding protein [bacterium]
MEAADKVTLQAWINDFNPESKKWITDTMMADFEAKNPNIKVEMQFIGWSHHSEKYLTAWAGGEVPDIFEPALEQAAEMIAEKQVIPLDEYVAKWGQIGDFFPVGYEPYMQGGKYYTIPFRLDIRNIYYRKDIFKEVGLDPEKGPDTWDDLRAMALKLNVRKGNKLERLGFNVEIGNFGAQEFVEFVWQSGVEMLNEAQNKATFNVPKGVEALEFLTKLYNDLRPVGTATLPQSPIPYFATGQLPMSYGGSWLYRNVLTYAPDRIGDVGVSLPLMKVKRVNNVFGGGFSITTKTKHPAEAWKFIEYFVSTETQAKYNELVGNMPSRKSVVEYKFFQNPVLRKVLDSAQYGKVYVIVPTWWEMLTKLGDQLELSYNLKKSPKQALDDAAAEWDRILSKK